LRDPEFCIEMLWLAVLGMLGLATKASALVLYWPTTPITGGNYSSRWTNDGVPPYTLEAVRADTTQTVFSYYGSDNITWWTVSLDPGAKFYYYLVDSAGVSVTSNTLTVGANPVLSAASIASMQSIVSVLSTQSVLSVESLASIVSVAQQTPTSQPSGTPGPTSSTNPTGSPSPGPKNHNGATAGIAVAIVLGVLALVAAVVFVLLRWRRNIHLEATPGNPGENALSPLYSIAPSLTGGHQYTPVMTEPRRSFTPAPYTQNPFTITDEDGNTSDVHSSPSGRPSTQGGSSQPSHLVYNGFPEL